MHLLIVVAGSLRPTIPIHFGQKVLKCSGLKSGSTHRTTPWPRVWPLLMIERSVALSSLARTLSNSSMANDGCQS
jgi:hypothetical protein